MKAVHTLMIHAICPHNPTQTDYYEVRFEVSEFRPVETIESHVERFRGKEMFQEELTQKLADASECWVTTSGLHGTTKLAVTCSPKVV